MKHILIENEGAFDHARHNVFPGEEIVWHTTSPWLLKKLPALGEKVRSLEEDVRFEDHFSLGKSALSFADRFCAHLDSLCPGPDNISIAAALRLMLVFDILVLLYKHFLFKTWVERFKRQGQLFVVGKAEIRPVNDVHTACGRFDNLYAFIASKAYPSAVRLIEHEPASGEKVVKEIMRSTAGAFEKMLYFCNHSPSGILSRLWTILLKKRLFPSRELCFPGKRHGRVCFLKSCELLTDTFVPLLKKGVSVRQARLADLSCPLEPMDCDLDSSDLLKEAHRILEAALRENGRIFSLEFDPLLKVFVERVMTALGYGLSFIDQLPAVYEKLSGQSADQPVAFVTNCLATPREKIFQQYVVQKGGQIFTMEHGISAGIDGSTEFCHARGYISVGGDCWICHNEASFRAYVTGRDEFCGTVAGGSYADRSIPWRRMQRILVRKMFKVKNRERFIVYLALLNRNNMIVGPYCQNDLQYLRHLETIATQVLAQVDGPSLIKLYPSNRYLDPDPFISFKRLPERIRVNQYYEFKFLRAAADVIILSSAQSTFGIAWSAKVPVIFIELPCKPLLPGVKELFKEALFYVDGSLPDWPGKVRALLQLPQKEFNRCWEEKRQGRDKLGSFIFGPPQAGERAAGFISDAIRQ